jgi:hypothetical protein
MTQPALYREWEELAVFAEGILIGREEGFPGLVRVGKMTHEDADLGIAVARALAEIWRAAFECRIPDPEKIGTVDDTDICLDLIVATQRIERLIARLPGSPLYRRQHARLEALFWWHRKHTQGPIWCVRITHEFRRLNAAIAARKAA